VGEFASAVVYMEQMMQMFPPEQTCRLRLLPAFEESLMRAAEAQNEEMNKWKQIWLDVCVCLALFND